MCVGTGKDGDHRHASACVGGHKNGLGEEEVKRREEEGTEVFVCKSVCVCGSAYRRACTLVCVSKCVGKNHSVSVHVLKCAQLCGHKAVSLCML